MELYVIIATGWLYFPFKEDAFDLAYGKICNSISVSSVVVIAEPAHMQWLAHFWSKRREIMSGAEQNLQENEPDF